MWEQLPATLYQTITLLKPTFNIAADQRHSLLDPLFSMWKLIGLNLFSAPLCVLLFVTKNSIYLSKIAPGNGFCIDCRMDLLFYWAMAALWLSS